VGKKEKGPVWERQKMYHIIKIIFSCYNFLSPTMYNNQTSANTTHKNAKKNGWSLHMTGAEARSE